MHCWVCCRSSIASTEFIYEHETRNEAQLKRKTRVKWEFAIVSLFESHSNLNFTILTRMPGEQENRAPRHGTRNKNDSNKTQADRNWDGKSDASHNEYGTKTSHPKMKWSKLYGKARERDTFLPISNLLMCTFTYCISSRFSVSFCKLFVLRKCWFSLFVFRSSRSSMSLFLSLSRLLSPPTFILIVFFPHAWCVSVQMSLGYFINYIIDYILRVICASEWV